MSSSSYSETSSFDSHTGYLLLPFTQASACHNSTRWNFASDNAFETPAPFTKQFGGPGASMKHSQNDVVMSDGRQFTDYRPHDVTQLQGRKAMSSTQEFRQMRLREGEAIREKERLSAHRNVSATCKFGPNDIGTMVPEQDVFVCNKIGCERVDTPYSCLGIGTGRRGG
jgi:hypothetical protein